MAKLFFVGLDGTEKSYRLQTHRPITIGRDPGNDIILRDPKDSRHHAEIVFERGFFVLHDLASANGTYVNAKRVRVAPLTHGAKLRMGNTYGRFSEELPTESDAENQEGYDQAAPRPDLGSLATNAHESYNNPAATQPHDKVASDDVKKKAN